MDRARYDTFVKTFFECDPDAITQIFQELLAAARAEEALPPGACMSQNYEKARANGVKPIIGMEAYLAKRGRRMQDRDNNFDRSPHHLLLLAMNQTGYKNLMRLATLSQLEGFYYKPRIDHDALAEFSETYPALATGRLKEQYDRNRSKVTCRA